MRYGSGSGRYLAKRLRDLAAEASALAEFAEGLPVMKSDSELAHEQRMREWEERGGLHYGPPPVPVEGR